MLLQDTSGRGGNATGEAPALIVLRRTAEKIVGWPKYEKELGCGGGFCSHILSAGVRVQAAAAPNLSGDWKLNAAKSNYGKFPAPLSVTRKIIHNDPKLIMSTTQTGPRGDVTSNLVYTTDGKESVNGDSKGSAQWIGDKLMIDSSREVQGATLKQKEIWTLSADGKTLTIDSHVSIPNGEFDVKQVFDKQ